MHTKPVFASKLLLYFKNQEQCVLLDLHVHCLHWTVMEKELAVLAQPKPIVVTSVQGEDVNVLEGNGNPWMQKGECLKTPHANQLAHA